MKVLTASSNLKVDQNPLDQLLLTLGEEDPVFFSEYFLGVHLNPFQQRALLVLCKRRILVPIEQFVKQFLWVTGNQVGKTVALAVAHIWFNFYKKGFSGESELIERARYETLNISPISRQATEAFKYVEEILNSNFSWEENGKRYINKCRIGWFWEDKNENLGIIYFKNNSSFWCLSTSSDQGSGLAGKQFGFISYDECVQCYSEDTEVLTENGWKKFNEVSIGEYVYSLNIKNNLVEKAKVGKVIWEDYRGEMIKFGGKQNKVDLLVTPNHKMLIKKSLGANQYGQLEFEIAENLFNKHFQLTQDFQWEGKKIDFWTIPSCFYGRYKKVKPALKIPINDFLLLLGFYISEGSIWKNQITIAQMPFSKGWQEIKNLLGKLPFSCKFKKVRFLIFDKQLAKFLGSFVKGKSFEKRIPRDILELDKSYLIYLFKGLMLGDGKGERSYGTSSKNLADDFSELCLKLGFIPTIKEYDDRGSRGHLIRGREIIPRHKFYVISIRVGEKFPRINHHIKNKKWASVSRTNYVGKIGCLLLEKNHTLLVRKNGRVIWSGNSLHLEDELGARIFSRIAKYSGWVVLVSTPDELGKSQQYWYHLYTQSKQEQEKGIIGDWYLIEGLYDENIFISEEKRNEFKDRLKKNFPNKYLQVVEGKFLASADRMFTPEMVEGLWNIRTQPTESVKEEEYVLIIDWGVADAGDETVMGVAKVTDLKKVEVVNAYSKQGGDPVELMAMATYFRMQYNDCPIVMDVTEMGGTIFKKMMSTFKPISFGQGNKPDALFFLQLRMRENIRENLTKEEKSATGYLKSYHLPKMERQLASYKIDDKKIKQDWVMMLAMLAWYVEKFKKASQTKIFNLNKFYNR